MKGILIDTNVILDILRDRKSYAEASASVWAAVEAGAVEGMLSAHAVTTIHYLVRKEIGAAKTKQIISSIVRVLGIAAVNDTVIREALQSPLTDFEDAVTAAAARLAGCAFIVTRDPKGFRGSPVPSITPEALIPLLSNA